MKNIFKVLFVTAALFAFANRGHAQQVASYCSGYNAVGNWSIYAGQLTTQISCMQVQNYLTVRGGAPTYMQSGFYYTVGINRVMLNCSHGLFVRYFWGTGGYPIQAAFNEAQASRLPYCLFKVY